ncbi:hypothetical protein [Burkholderia stagnalis]|uniref:hypothetical protein n=1 Tax=Burkholderia stagnalis TaxID=1503054 RepID=UPI000A860407|nr:hypothetical protein [Burkholderia stagnalis]
MTTDKIRADALTEAITRTIETIKRQLDLIADRASGDFLDKRPVVQSLGAHVRRLEKALAASPVEQPAQLTAQDALAAIETFEIVGEGNDSREPNADDRFVLTEFIAHAFGGYPVEQLEAATADARAHWKTGTPPTKDGEHHEYIVAVRRAHDKRRVFVFAASHANNYADDLHDQDGKEFIADGWYDIGEDPSGEFNTLFTPTLGPDDEVLGWQELPKWSAATSAQLEPTVTNGQQEAAPAEGAIDPSEQLINFSGHSLTLTGAQLLEALDFIAPDRDRDQLDSELTFQRGEGHAGNGMYCWVTEYPEEGAIFVDGSTAIPAEAERAPADERAATPIGYIRADDLKELAEGNGAIVSPRYNETDVPVFARAAFAYETGAEGAAGTRTLNVEDVRTAKETARQVFAGDCNHTLDAIEYVSSLLEATDAAWSRAGSHAPQAAVHAGTEPASLTAAARDVLAERRRQVGQEGWTPAHDDKYRDHELSCAAGCYAMHTLAYPAGDPPPAWPWAAEWWKPTTHRRNLVKAGALIQAAIERLDRATAAAGERNAP